MRRWPLTARGTAALVIAAVALVAGAETGILELTSFGVLLLALTGLGLGSLWLGGAPAATARRIVPDVSVTGRATTVTVRVTPPGRLRSRQTHWHEQADHAFAGTLDGDLVWAGRDEAAVIAYTVTPTVRGDHRLGSLRIVSVDPFGLARRRIRVLPAVTVRVSPAPADLPPLRAVPAAGAVRRASIADRGHGVDDLLARPYQPGDSRRRIHWRASAHHDELMIRQEENEAAPDATVVLDLDGSRWSADAALGPGRDLAFEAAVSATVSALDQLLQQGFTVTVLGAAGVALGDPVHPGERALRDAVVATLATLLAVDDPGIVTFLPAAARAGSGPLVIVTGAIDETDVVDLASIGNHIALPVLLAAGAAPAALERAREHGWYAHALRVGPDMPGWWDDAGGAA